MTVAVAQAHPNIAFIKYWGNTDHSLRLPANSSISMNLSGVETETRVTWDERLAADTLVLNGREEPGDALTRVVQHLDMLRKRLGLGARAQVETRNNFPTGAGIASSAAAFAALTVAGVAAAGATLTERELTTLARLGSGSASRSVPSGFVEWHAASTHEDSYAETAFAPDHWALVDVIAVISRAHKATGSTAGHRSADTSDLQAARVAGAARRLEICKAAIAARDFAAFAEVVEYDSNLMHAVMMTSRPALFYWLPGSLALMERVRQLRHDGVRVCYTLDAGPNVHCICVREDADQVRSALSSMSEVGEIIVASAGYGARVTKQS
ncbi:MAG: diphosphomevalonate decarboxylase [Chloroflexota bacterium]|nr:diphosphomevalonate decarboxylase [Chloroflexota bacterium]